MELKKYKMIGLVIFCILFVLCFLLYSGRHTDIPVNITQIDKPFDNVTDSTIDIPENTTNVSGTNVSQNTSVMESKNRNISITPLNKKLQPHTRTFKSSCNGNGNSNGNVPEFSYLTLGLVLIVTSMGITILRKRDN